ncbi:unnamed protein product [marine sediment metagenome]|uniref:Uncharacterized protein n=1 Tax=marine sediment metagenome TaxID=412755 RepID=X0Z428_9ZZZZ
MPIIVGTMICLFLAREVEGFKYRIDVVLNFTEAYKIIGMTAPDV